VISTSLFSVTSSDLSISLFHFFSVRVIGLWLDIFEYNSSIDFLGPYLFYYSATVVNHRDDFQLHVWWLKLLT